MSLPRPTLWDGKSLPYKPTRPVLLYHLKPGEIACRVAVPNGRGEYHNLVPGLQYFEEEMAYIPLVEMPLPALSKSVGTQVEFHHLPVPPPAQMERYLEGATSDEHCVQKGEAVQYSSSLVGGSAANSMGQQHRGGARGSEAQEGAAGVPLLPAVPVVGDDMWEFVRKATAGQPVPSEQEGSRGGGSSPSSSDEDTDANGSAKASSSRPDLHSSFGSSLPSKRKRK